MMFKFVTTDIGTLERKRSTQRACDECRKRKKRCPHDRAEEAAQLSAPLLKSTSQRQSDGVGARSGWQSQGNSPQLQQPQARSSPENAASFHGRQSSSRRRNQNLPGTSEAGPQHGESSPAAANANDARFIGDLNPEGVFLAATSPGSTRGGSSGKQIGVWLAEKFKKSGEPDDLSCVECPSSLFYGSSSMIQKVFVPILAEECLSTLPPVVHRDALCAVYFEKIHPILPIVNEAAYRNLPAHSPARVLLQQGMCLAVSMDFSARAHLVLSDTDHPQTFSDFGRRLLASMRIAVEMALVTDKIILIQALALMSSFIDGRDGTENSSLIIGKTVQHVQSLGLHIQDRNRDSDPGQGYAGTIFCYVWALDRLNAALHGRPVLMHERDIELPLPQCFDAQSPSFKLLLHVVLLLDRVIKLYRPGIKEDEALNQEFPLFEELVMSCGALQVPTYQLATIEVLYHAIAILSCRTRSSDTSLGSSSAHIRKSLSASRVTVMAGHEFHNQLVLLPFVPYAVSLSLSVAYQEMRRTKVPFYRARARNDLQANCRILEELGEIFWSAAVMADMGNKTLRELDRVFSNIADAQSRRATQKSGSQPNTGMIDAPARIFSMTNHFDENNPTLTPDIDPFLFTEMSELDPFEMFDPNFDLQIIDACLEGNLDLAFSTSLQ